MDAAEHLPLADVKNRLSEVIERLEREHGRVVVTKHGRPAVVMLSVEDLESLEETLDILSNPSLRDETARAIAMSRQAAPSGCPARTCSLARAASECGALRGRMDSFGASWS